MLATFATRRTTDYHHLEDEAEAALDYMQGNDRKPGVWVGARSETLGLAGKEATVDDFARKSFGFEHRKITKQEIESHGGVDPALETWALLEIDLFKIERFEDRISLAQSRLEEVEVSRKSGKTKDRETKRQLSDIDRMDTEREVILKRHGGLRNLKKKIKAARKESGKTETEALHGADPAGLAGSLLKSRIAGLEGGSGANPDGKTAARIAELKKRAEPFVSHANEIEAFRRQSERLRARAKLQRDDPP